MKFTFKAQTCAAVAATKFKSSPSEPSSTQTPPPLQRKKDLPSHLAQSDLSISDLDHCIVNLLPSALSSSSSGNDTPLIITALHARNLLPNVDGGALIHDLERCVVVLGCHQVRFELFKPLCFSSLSCLST